SWVDVVAGTNLLVTQTRSNDGLPYLMPLNGQVYLYSEYDCTDIKTYTVDEYLDGTISISGAPTGRYILGIKYDLSGSLSKYVPVGTPTVTYTFDVNGGTSASITIEPQAGLLATSLTTNTFTTDKVKGAKKK
ncbi:MAG: hypothetical protein JW990_01430, partial [Thermoleophilia bacterium]|nr:hypothetical protein [Thermoleophilia bacterium]